MWPIELLPMDLVALWHVGLVPWPGIKTMSPTLQGGFFTAGPPGKSLPALTASSLKKAFSSFSWFFCYVLSFLLVMSCCLNFLFLPNILTISKEQLLKEFYTKLPYTLRLYSTDLTVLALSKIHPFVDPLIQFLLCTSTYSAASWHLFPIVPSSVYFWFSFFPF